jgi:hypothetical protein
VFEILIAAVVSVEAHDNAQGYAAATGLEVGGEAEAPANALTVNPPAIVPVVACTWKVDAAPLSVVDM